MQAPAFLADGLAARGFGLAGSAQVGECGGALFEETDVLALFDGELAKVCRNGGKRFGRRSGSVVSDLHQAAVRHGEMMPR